MTYLKDKLPYQYTRQFVFLFTYKLRESRILSTGLSTYNENSKYDESRQKKKIGTPTRVRI